MKAIFDMIQHFSTLFNTVMTDIEDLRQVARIARGEGRALDILIRRHACYRKTSGIGPIACPKRGLGNRRHKLIVCPTSDLTRM